jgi:hypothetical protein
MAADYERISARSREDPGTAGDEGEEDWATLLRGWLPSTYHVQTKGQIVFSSGEASPQVDVVVLAPSYPVGLLKEKIYLAAGVLAAFECKNSLRLTYIPQAIKTGIRLRELARDARSPLQHEIVYGLLAHSHDVRAKLPHESIANALVRADSAFVKDPRDCMDVVCVADVGTWALMRFTTRVASSSQGAEEDEADWKSLEIITTYMGPINADPSTPYAANPIGRMLTNLLGRLGSTDPQLGAIADYFRDVGLFGVGQGVPRHWSGADFPHLPLTATRTIY